MSRLHLIRKSDNSPVGAPFPGGGWIPHPNKPRGKLGSPARAGWEDGAYRVVEVAYASAPVEGKRRTGQKQFSYSARTGMIVECYTEEDIPAPRVQTDAEKLERATGLSVAQFKALLA
jgi:hypothetical protein